MASDGASNQFKKPESGLGSVGSTNGQAMALRRYPHLSALNPRSPFSSKGLSVWSRDVGSIDADTMASRTGSEFGCAPVRAS